jgi:mannosyltransferase
VAGRRLGGRVTATIAVLLLAASPFAIRYATEARMYSLVTLLTLAGYLAVVRALESPRPARLGLVALLSAALVLSHYWNLYLTGTALVVVALIAWRDPARRAAGTRVAVAIAVGWLGFLPWLGSFLEQARHTGTPWGRTLNPFDAVQRLVFGFGGGKWPVGLFLGPLLMILALAAIVDRSPGRFTLRRSSSGTQIAAVLAVAVGTTVAGLAAAMLASSAFQARYAAGVVPLVLLAAAVGISRLPSPTMRNGVVIVVIAVSLVGSVNSVSEQRTQAGSVAAAIRAGSQRGDVIGFCPDQLEPAVHRVLGRNLTELTFPSDKFVGRVDWTDYTSRVRATDPDQFARALLARAGPSRTVWLAWATRYHGFGHACEAVVRSLEASGRRSTVLVRRNTNVFEKETLVRFAAS